MAFSLADKVGEEWRGDWSEFDGRYLDMQLGNLSSVASGHMTAGQYRDSYLEDPS